MTVLMLVAMAISAMGGPAVARRPVQHLLTYGSCRVQGVGEPGTKVKVAWRGADGELKQVQTVKVARNITWSTACDPDERVWQGDVITTVTDGRTRRVTVPRMSISVDRDTDVISGVGPTTGELGASGVDIAVDPDGRWSFGATPPGQFRGGETWRLAWTSPKGDSVWRDMMSPTIYAYPGLSEVVLYGRPGKRVSARLLDGSDVERASVGCQLGRSGACRLEFIDDAGDPIVARPGDRVVSSDIASDAMVPIRAIGVTASAATDQIQGGCPDYNNLVVTIHHPGQSRVQTFWRGWGGGFRIDASSHFDIRSGDRVEVICQTLPGDIAARRYTVP
jgi:hypothetical protein